MCLFRTVRTTTIGESHNVCRFSVSKEVTELIGDDVQRRSYPEIEHRGVIVKCGDNFKFELNTKRETWVKVTRIFKEIRTSTDTVEFSGLEGEVLSPRFDMWQNVNPRFELNDIIAVDLLNQRQASQPCRPIP